MSQTIASAAATPSRLTRARRLLATAPFTARLGMVVVTIYAFVAIFAPWICLLYTSPSPRD